MFLDRLLARLDFRGVARDRADDAAAEHAFDQRRVHPVGQIAGREFGEGARKRRLAGNLRAPFPPADAAQRLVDGQAFDECAGSGYAEHDLADESPGERAPILGWPTGTAWRRRNEGLQADGVENDDEASEHFGQRVDFFA